MSRECAATADLCRRYDARGRPLERGQHVTDELAAPRGRVRLTLGPWGLTVAALRERDAGLYVCRAEFTASSTRTSVTRLQVIGERSPEAAGHRCE